MLSALVMGAPAFAHNSFVGSDPKSGATLAKAPKEIELTFLATVSAKTTKATITGPDGGEATGGELRFDGKKVYVPLEAGVAGGYTVAYEIQSSDGHPIKGKVEFTLTAGAVPSPSVTAAAPSPSAVEASSAAASVAGPSFDPAASAEPDEGGTPWWVWALGGLVVVAAVGVGTVLYGRR